MVSEETNQKNSTSSPLLLNWHKVQIYGLFFAVALIYVASSIPFFINTRYGEYTEYTYNICGPLKTVDMLFGLLSLAYAAFLIYLRFQLAQYKKKSLFYMDIAYLIPGVLHLAYQFFSSLVAHTALKMTFGEVFDSISSFLLLIGCIIACILNHIYYSKRYESFIN